MKRRRILVLFAVTLLGIAGCTEPDDSLRAIGVTVMSFTNPGLDRHSVEEYPMSTDFKVQAISWNVTKADLALPEGTADLLGGGSCAYEDSVAIFPVGAGSCTSGVILPASAEPVSATLTLAFSATVHRAQPPDLSAGGDFDADGVTNDLDNCPLAANAGQVDCDADGLGDACDVCDGEDCLNSFDECMALEKGLQLDSDADGFIDIADNCLEVANALQEDATIPPDGIGDACTEETATLQFSMSDQLQLNGVDPGALLQQAGGILLLTVDFGALHPLTCDWVAGVCDLPSLAGIKVCLRTDFASSIAGCS